MISQSLSFTALSPADWPRDLPVTALPPVLCEVQTVGRWRQGEEGVSSVVFSLRHSRHGSTRQETETQSYLQSKPNQELSPAYFLYLEAILSWRTYCYRRLIAFLICYSFFFLSPVCFLEVWTFSSSKLLWCSEGTGSSRRRRRGRLVSKLNFICISHLLILWNESHIEELSVKERARRKKSHFLERDQLFLSSSRHGTHSKDGHYWWVSDCWCV